MDEIKEHIGALLFWLGITIALVAIAIFVLVWISSVKNHWKIADYF